VIEFCGVAVTPLIVTDCAPVTLHCSVTAWPAVMFSEEAVKLWMSGSGAGVLLSMLPPQLERKHRDAQRQVNATNRSVREALKPGEAT